MFVYKMHCRICTTYLVVFFSFVVINNATHTLEFVLSELGETYTLDNTHTIYKINEWTTTTAKTTKARARRITTTTKSHTYQTLVFLCSILRTHQLHTYTQITCSLPYTQWYIQTHKYIQIDGFGFIFFHSFVSLSPSLFNFILCFGSSGVGVCLFIFFIPSSHYSYWMYPMLIQCAHR